jgi:hypothetical protein
MLALLVHIVLLDGSVVRRDAEVFGNKTVSLKVKINLSLCLINEALYHSDRWGSGDIAPQFLTPALDGSEWLVSRPSRFTNREIASILFR